MSEENKEKPFETPMVPFFGLDMARELGAIDARLKQLEGDNREIKREIKEVDAKLSAKIEAVDGRVDKCLVAINRLDERTQGQGRTIMVMGGAILAAVIAGIIIQLFSK